MIDPQRDKSAGRTGKSAVGAPMAGLEKSKVLNQNCEELRQIAPDDAILMAGGVEQIRQARRAAQLISGQP
ncbi:MAG: hypothetical protein NTX56_11685 [Proteobacteria bacterium]|nr:hypothetical protein [Pseudomonadota bacterium]